MIQAINNNGTLISVKKFSTLKSANKYINKNKDRKIIYFRSHEYFVTLK